MSNFNGRRGNSASPTDKSANGGVPIVGQNLEYVERAGNVNKPYAAFNLPQWNGPPQNAGQAVMNADPFDKSASSAKNGAKLSADASSFKPDGDANGPSPIRVLNRDSTADEQPVIVKSVTPTDSKDKTKPKSVSQQPIGTPNGNVTPSRPKVVFTTDVGPGVDFRGGHYVKLENVQISDVTGNIKYLTQEFNWDSKLRGHKAPPPGKDSKYLTYFYSFDDIVDAAQAVEDAEIVNPDWAVSFITQAEYAGAPTTHGTQETTSFYDGQLVFVATFDGLTSEFNATGATDAVFELAKSFGKVYVFTEIQTATYPNLEFRCEYNKISSAKAALEKATKESPIVAGKWSVYAKEMPNYTKQSAGMGDVTNGMTGLNINTTPSKHVDGNGSQYYSPTGRTAWRIDEQGNEVPAPPPRSLPKVGPFPYGGVNYNTPVHDRGRYHSAPQSHTPAYMYDRDDRVMRSGSWNGYSYASPSPVRASGPQTVETWKIENGQDVRTTVMLRNIPNKMDCWQLKQILDVTSFGKYDFSYLRIDFHQGTNVGYAFVNFADPMDIVPLVENHVGKPWVEGNKRKCELSYATIQGYDCLVEKFRNSAIMSEYRDYRPKLWYTAGNAPHKSMIGAEMPFPGANNLSKKQRSHDNAGQIGLYAPHSGHMSRERYRRSQYDRGTPAQLHEDAIYQQYNQMSPLQNQYGFYDTNYAYGAPHMPMGPPPAFPPMMYGHNGYEQNQYLNGAGYMTGNGHAYFNGNGYPVAPYDGADPFGAGAYYGGYNNGFGMGAGMPASRLRTMTKGRLGNRPKKSSNMPGNFGGPVQSPDGGYGDYGYMPKVVEGDEYANGGHYGYNNHH